MAEVITRLKVDNQGYDQKIKKAQQSLDQFGLKGTEVGQKMSGLSRALSLNVGTLSKWSVGLGAASTALKVAGDAFRHNETNMDAWNATMDSAKSAYESFLTALNTSDFSSFFTNINNVIAAARDAYNSLDNLGTYQAFAARGNAKNRAAYSEAVANFKENKTDENRDAVKAASDAVVADLEEQKRLTAKAYTDAVKKLALEQGMTGSNVDEFVDMFANRTWADLSAAKAGYAKGSGLNRATYWNGYEVQGNDLITRDAGGVAIDRRAMTESEQAAFRFARALNEVSDEAIRSTQALGAQEAQLDQAIADQRRNAARMLGESKTTTTTDANNPIATSIAAQEEEVKRLREQFNNAGRDVQGVFYQALDKAEKKLQQMKEIAAQMGVTLKSSLDAKAPANLDDEIAKMNTNLAKVGKTAPVTAKATGDAWIYASQAVAGVGSALQGLEDPGAKVAGIVAAAIAQVAAGLGSMLAQPQSTSQSWGWIALAASGAATMVGTIAAIKQATEYHAEGGIAGIGNIFQSKGTDVVPAMLTPGEEVLPTSSPRHINNIGSLIGQTQQQSTPYVDAELIFLGLNNFLQRTGRGEIVTSRR